MLFLGPFSPGMIIDKMNDVDFIHNQGGKLYGINITSQTLWVVLIVEKGFGPSVASPSLTLRGSQENFGYRSSKAFHAKPSAGCLNFPSLVRSV